MSCKYGLIVFNKTKNIGDDIQSYAAKQFLPRVDYYVEREVLNEFIPDDREVVKTIMSGWYTHAPHSFPPSPFLNPIITSIHLSNHTTTDTPEYMHGIFNEYLRNHSPIGSRDSTTAKYLKNAGVCTEFSGCLTLTIKPFTDIKKVDVVYAVDVSERVVDKLRSVLDLEVEVITHDLDETKNSKLTYEQRMLNVENLLKKFQSASLVVTSRLHCCLPTLALGGNPLLIYDETNPDVQTRLGDYLPFINHCSEEAMMQSKNKTVLLSGSGHRLADHKLLASSLRRKVSEFIKEKKNDRLPNISPKQYKEFFVSQKQYLSKTYDSEVNALLSRVGEMEDYIQQQNKQIKALSSQLALLERRTGVAMLKKLIRK